ncbi:MAG: hypothetical protein P3X22_006300 [Thermoprotei archaeon]|nr:hypothetical protein [Thermoprotei archaeon]
MMVLYAGVDSVNICALSTTVVLSLYAASLGFQGLGKAALPFSFIAGVYVGYVLVGLAVSWVLSYVRVLLLLVVLLAVLLLVLDLREALREESRACRVGECVPSWLQRVKGLKLLFGAFIYGVLVSWSFMMCSAAPYILFLGILSAHVKALFVKVIMVLAYCIIIIAPLVLASLIPMVIAGRLMASLRTVLLARAAVMVLIIALGAYYLAIL